MKIILLMLVSMLDFQQAMDERVITTYLVTWDQRGKEPGSETDEFLNGDLPLPDFPRLLVTYLTVPL